MTLRPLPASLLPVLALAATLSAQTNPVVLEVGTAQLDAKQRLSNVSFSVQGGKIREVEQRQSADARSRLQGERRWSFPSGYATAGFVDMHSSLGAANELAEQVVSFFPQFDASDAYDPAYPGWKQLAPRGVTSLVLAPSDTSLVGGLAAFLRPGQAARPEASYMKFSLTRSMLNREREPTSLLGAADLLKRKFDEFEKPEPGLPKTFGPGMARFGQVIGGNQSVGVACQTPAEILQAIKVIQQHRLNAFLLHADEADLVLDELAKSQLAVVLQPLTLGSNERARKLPKLLEERGIPFAFAGESTNRIALPTLQTTLALLVQSGVDPMRALASVTSEPARLCGLEDRVGSLLRGRDADLVVWSHAPHDLRSRPLLVLRQGELLYEADSKPTTKKGAKL